MVKTKLGRAKGKRLKNSMFPKMAGYCFAGSAKKPPKLGPMTEPKLQTRGMILKALGCSSLSGTISATMVLMIPTGRLLVENIKCGRGTRTIAVSATLDSSHGNGHGQARRHAPNHKAHHGTQEAGDDGGLSTIRIRCLSPANSGDTLGDGEDTRGDTSPASDLVCLDTETLNHRG